MVDVHADSLFYILYLFLRLLEGINGTLSHSSISNEFRYFPLVIIPSHPCKSCNNVPGQLASPDEPCIMCYEGRQNATCIGVAISLLIMVIFFWFRNSELCGDCEYNTFYPGPTACHQRQCAFYEHPIYIAAFALACIAMVFSALNNWLS